MKNPGSMDLKNQCLVMEIEDRETTKGIKRRQRKKSYRSGKNDWKNRKAKKSNIWIIGFPERKSVNKIEVVIQSIIPKKLLKIEET